MANRYWIGDGGDWADTAHWSTTSGGSGGASVPTSADDVFFDANSFSIADQIVTIQDPASYDISSGGIGTAEKCNNINFTGVDNAPHFAFAILEVYGNVTLSAGIGGFDDSTRFVMKATSTGKTITTAGIDFYSMYFVSASGGWTFQDTVMANTSAFHGIYVYAGNVDLNDQECHFGTIAGQGLAGAWTLSFGTNDIYVNSMYLDVTTAFGAVGTGTVNGETSTINSEGGSSLQISLTGAITLYDIAHSGSSGFTLSESGTGTKTIHALTLTGAFVPEISGSFTFTNLTYTGYSGAGETGMRLTAGKTITVTGTLTATGSSSARPLIIEARVDGNYHGTSATINANAVSLTDVYFSDIVGTGSATWSGTRLGNCGGNSGITFASPVTRYWVGNGGNWDDTSHWSATSGGTSGASAPLPQDTAIFDANSFSTGSQTVSMRTHWNAGMDWSAVDSSPTLDMNFAGEFFGSVIFASGMTVISADGYIHLRGRSSYSFDPAGHTIDTSVAVSAVGGTYTLLGNLTMASNTNFRLYQGTFDANDFNVTCDGFEGNTGNNDLTKTLIMGSGTWDITNGGTASGFWSFNEAGLNTNLTVTAETSLIIARNFVGGGKTYYDLELEATDDFTFLNCNNAGGSFHDLTMTTTSTTQQTGISGDGFTVTGTLTITGSSAVAPFLFTAYNGSPTTFTVNAVSLSDVWFQNITASGASIDWTGTRLGDLGGNTHITFTSTTRYWIGNGGDWSDSAHWSNSSGGASASTIPLPQDDAIFDANSFSTSAQTVQLLAGAYCKSLNFSAVDEDATFDVAGFAIYVYGSLTLDAGMTYTDSVGDGHVYMKATSGTVDITSNGNTLGFGLRSVPSNGVTVRLADALEIGDNLYLELLNGTFDANDQNLSVAHLSIYPDEDIASSAVTVLMGSGTWTLRGDDNWDYALYVNDSDQGVTITKETSTIYIAGATASRRTIQLGGGHSYNNLTYEQSDVDSGLMIYQSTDVPSESTVALFTILPSASVPALVWFDSNAIQEYDINDNPVGSPARAVHTFTDIAWDGTLDSIVIDGLNEDLAVNSEFLLNVGTFNQVINVNVTNSDASAGIVIDASDGGTDGGGNTNWSFEPVTYITTSPLTLTFSLPSATASISITASPSVLSATFSLPAVTVTAIMNVTVSPSPLTATFSLPPSLAEGATQVSVSPLELTLSIQSPTVTAIQNPTINPSPLELTLSTPAPTITAERFVTVTPNVLEATFSTPAVTITEEQNADFSASPLSLTLSIPAVSVSTHVSIAPSVLAMTFSLPSSTVTAIQNATASPSALELTLSIPAVTVTAERNAIASPSVLTATFTIPAYTVTAEQSVTVSPSVLAMTFSLPSSTARTSVSIAPSVLAMTFSIPTVTVTATRFVTISAESLLMTFRIPSIAVVADYWQPKYPVENVQTFEDKVYNANDNWSDKF